MSVYNLYETWTPVKEKRGLLRNTSTCNVEYAITEGALPMAGAVLLPEEKIEFNLAHPHLHAHHFGFHHHHPKPHFKTLFIRAVAATSADTVVIDNLERSDFVSYDVSGIATWAKGKTYKEGQVVLYEKHLYTAKIDHTSGLDFDEEKWDMVASDVLSVTVEDDKITVKMSDGTETTTAVNNVANAISATNDSAGNNIATSLAAIKADIEALKVAVGI